MSDPVLSIRNITIDYIGATGWHTGGGTSEILRNIIAKEMGL